MKKLLLFIICYIPLFLNAQYFEMGLSIGGSNYLGELASNSSKIDLRSTNIAAGAFARYNLHRLITLRLHGNYTILSGDDSNSRNEAISNRNLSFRTNLYEVGLVGEFNLFGYQPYNYVSAFSPYLFGGISLYKFDPQTELDGQLYSLQPLGTEGQNLEEFPDRLPYELTQIAVPFGFGFKYALSEDINIGFEIGARKLFTDYLDDVSLTYPDRALFNSVEGAEIAALLSDRNLVDQGNNGGLGRGDTKATDWYFITSFTISYNFADNGLIGGRRRGGKSGCVTF